MKVHNLIDSSKPLVRGLFVVALVWGLAAGGASAPVSAIAEETPLTQAPPVSTEVTVTAAAPSVLATPTLVVAPAPVAKAAVKKLTVPQIISKVGYASGLKKSEVAALLWMAKRESNYHPSSHSRSECHGLFQLSAGMAHGRPWKDPVWNTKRAIKYMRGRYGGVLKAKAFWVSHHWY